VDTAYITTLFEYDRWANARVLSGASKISAGQFTKDLGSSRTGGEKPLFSGDVCRPAAGPLRAQKAAPQHLS